MKTIGKNLRTLLAILLCLAMVFCMSACGNKEVVSEPEIVYGDEVDDGFGDEDVVGNAGASDEVNADNDGDKNTTDSNANNGDEVNDNKNNTSSDSNDADKNNSGAGADKNNDKNSGTNSTNKKPGTSSDKNNDKNSDTGSSDKNSDTSGSDKNSDKNSNTNSSNKKPDKNNGDKNSNTSSSTKNPDKNNDKNSGTNSTDKKPSTNNSSNNNNANSNGGVVTSTITKPNDSQGSANTESYDDGLVQKNEIDEGDKSDFLLSIPKKYSGKEVSILTWWEPFDYEIKKMERFTEATGIKVKFVYADNASYMQKLSSLKLQKNSPDIACIQAGQYPSAIIQDYFQPIDNTKLSFNSDTFDLESMNKLKWDGKRYGAIIKGNSHINFGILIYNADMFKKHGVTDPHTLWTEKKWNWDTLVSTAQEIQKKSGITALSTEYHGYRLSQSSGEDAVIFKNGKLVNNTGSETYREAYKFIFNLGLKGQHKVLDAGLNRDGFMNGQCSMFLEDSWALQSGERYENLSFTLGFAPIPCKKGVNAVPSDFQLWGFPVGAKNTDAAAYVLEYWLSPQFDEEGHNTWVNDSAAAMMDHLWDQPKVFKLSTGAIEYGGDYEWWDYNQQCADNGGDINSTMDRWSKVIDENLRKIYLD